MSHVRRVLLDECVPRALKRQLPEWEVLTVREHGWASMLDGELLRAAEAEFDAFITVDRRIAHQQNLAGFRLTLLILLAQGNSMRFLQPLVPELRNALGAAGPGEVIYTPRSIAP